MDGSLVTTQIGGGYFGKPLYLAGLFGKPANTTVLRAHPDCQRRNTRFFVVHRWRRTTPASLQFHDIFARKMLNYVQIATTPTADTPGTALLLHFDTQRYFFGQISEGTQRALVQRKLTLSKVENVFLSGTVNWHTAGGLLGMVLTVADALKEQMSAREQAAATKNKNKNKLNAFPVALMPPSLRIHAGKNISHLLATGRRFIFRKGMPLLPHEVRVDPRAAEGVTSEPDWRDDYINVWYMPLATDQKELETASPRKRSHDEFNESTVTTPSAFHNDESSQRVAEAVVTQMFDSNWTADALVETTLHQAKLPAKLFVRNDEGRLQVYTGPMPDSGQEVPDIPVLVRQPWPGATVLDLPRTEPSKQSMCYIVKGHDRRGRFNPEAAERLGVAKVDYRYLTQGQSVKGKDGMVVTPEMVLADTVPGSGFAVLDLPDVSYIDALIMKGVHVIFWLLGNGVVDDPRLQDFMKKMSSIKHIVTSADTCPNMIALESVATQAYKLWCIDPDRFPLPAHSNKESVSGTTATTPPSTYEIGRFGKTIQFAPQYLHQDHKIVPFPDLAKLARQDLGKGLLKIAAEAKSKISDPDFIAKVEKVEADIPNRDAEVITLGTGSALPSKYRNVSATLVRVPGYGNYLFDAGENTLGQLRRVFGHELPSVLQDLKVIWISHLHADHHLGTASVIKAWHEETSKTKPSAKLIVSSHVHMLDWVREYADVENFGFERLISIPTGNFNKTRVCDPRIFSTEETEQFGLVKIEAALVNHCFGALATAFTFPSGLKIAYSGDCRPSDAFVEIGQGATILIHESTFDDELKVDAVAKKHSTMSEAIDVGRRMGARRILLTHFSQRYQKIPILEENFEIHPDARTEDKAKEDEVILVAFDYMRVKLGEFRKAQAFLPAIQMMLEKADSE
ncbi:beta-lactamase-like protein [Xylaria cf. heliscus]|nr:beta-lactamase-like protein [Xylaria cf. heliscus]